MRPDVRPSPIAGTWYPGDADTLTRSVDETPPGRDRPARRRGARRHRATRRSHLLRPVAAYAFQTLRNLRPEVVAVVSPLHQPYPGQVLTSGHEAYATPLGKCQSIVTWLAVWRTLNSPVQPASASGVLPTTRNTPSRSSCLSCREP